MNNSNCCSYTLAGLSPRAKVLGFVDARDRIAAGSTDDEDYSRVAEWKSIDENLRILVKARGELYADCSFENYICLIRRQSDVVKMLTEYASNAEKNLAAGKNVVLFGTKGTGKDHLFMALAKQVMMETGKTARWINGIDLHQKLREAAYGKAAIEVAEYKAPILWISDLLPPKGSLTDSQQNLLFGLIDQRYSRKLPTWISLNIKGKEEADERLGTQVTDRLRQNILSIPMDWPSYRTARGDS